MPSSAWATPGSPACFCDLLDHAVARSATVPGRRGFMKARSILLSLMLGIGTACGSSEPAQPPPPTDPAAVGPKRVGTPAGAQAGDYLKARFEAAGLADVRFESFQLPRYDVTAKALALSVDGGPATTPAVDVFEASGTRRRPQSV